jgi:Predicted transcriptional regulators
MLNAIPEYHNLCGARQITFCDTPVMDSEEKNGGPNHLREWREFRKMSQQELATACGTTQHQIAYLESGERGLSAKWLRKLSVALDTTPGMILDHNPSDLDSDIIEIWATASNRQKRQLAEIAKTILKTGTDD